MNVIFSNVLAYAWFIILIWSSWLGTWSLTNKWAKNIRIKWMNKLSSQKLTGVVVTFWRSIFFVICISKLACDTCAFLWTVQNQRTNWKSISSRIASYIPESSATQVFCVWITLVTLFSHEPVEGSSIWLFELDSKPPNNFGTSSAWRSRGPQWRPRSRRLHKGHEDVLIERNVF